MISQSFRCSSLLRAARLSVVCLATLGAVLASGWLHGATAAAARVESATTKVVFLTDRSSQAAIGLGNSVATNLLSFREYCKNPVVATAEPKALCLEYTIGGSLEGDLSADDQPPGSEVPVSTSLPDATITSTLSVQPIDPYQYDRVQLFPLR